MTNHCPAPFRDYRSRIKVGPQHIDFMGHVNNAEYLRWAQETIIDAWQTHAPPAMIDKLGWVALEHAIRYRKPAHIDDTVAVEMSITGVRGSRVDVVAQFAVGDVDLARVHSVWCCIDMATRKPFRITETMISQFIS